MAQYATNDQGLLDALNKTPEVKLMGYTYVCLENAIYEKIKNLDHSTVYKMLGNVLFFDNKSYTADQLPKAAQQEQLNKLAQELAQQANKKLNDHKYTSFLIADDLVSTGNKTAADVKIAFDEAYQKNKYYMAHTDPNTGKAVNNGGSFDPSTQMYNYKLNVVNGTSNVGEAFTAKSFFQDHLSKPASEQDQKWGGAKWTTLKEVPLDYKQPPVHNSTGQWEPIPAKQFVSHNTYASANYKFDYYECIELLEMYWLSNRYKLMGELNQKMKEQLAYESYGGNYDYSQKKTEVKAKNITITVETTQRRFKNV